MAEACLGVLQDPLRKTDFYKDLKKIKGIVDKIGDAIREQREITVHFGFFISVFLFIITVHDKSFFSFQQREDARKTFTVFSILVRLLSLQYYFFYSYIN